ncbi:recombinase family protein [Paenibacillus sp. MZ04-78.2]|uniref:recombinase family protein n=1 Tax=Paenibacillus sp. MZ04-78.2 TaxID=2962034 RepID=UPI0020B6658E|nr:recombinase family protein [Paenibacillus sp. MZ04-78.2]MCP3775219.1 recombinase family protein [Paenibacillus sp. MZ04-78.2]
MTTNKTKVAIYARVNQEQEGLDNQLQALRAYCEANEIEIYAEYVDEGVSGISIERRHSLQRLLEDAEKQQFHEVLVWRIDRLSRKTIELISLVNELQQRHVQVRSVTENLDFSTPSGRYTLQMLAAVYEYEYNTAFRK